MRTGTAARADEWLPITPGTDAALLLAVAHTLFAEGLVDLGHLAAAHRRARPDARRWPRTGPPSGSPPSPASTPSASASWPANSPTTPRAVVYGRIGLCNQEFGSLASWLVDVVNILTGHFDVEGGLMFPRAAAWSVTVQPMPGLEDGVAEFGRFRTRVRGAKEVLGQVPVSCLAEEIATPGDGPDQGAVHRRGQPGAVDARRATSSTRRCRPRLR